MVSYSTHLASVSRAKDHLYLVSPDLRGQLARYLDLGEEPGPQLRAFIDNDLDSLFAIPRDGSGIIEYSLRLWLRDFAPKECSGTIEKRIAWQGYVGGLVRAEWDEQTSTEEAAE